MTTTLAAAAAAAVVGYLYYTYTVAYSLLLLVGYLYYDYTYIHAAWVDYEKNLANKGGKRLSEIGEAGRLFARLDFGAAGGGEGEGEGCSSPGGVGGGGGE